MSQDFTDIGQAAVIVCLQRPNYSSTNGNVDDIKEKSDAGMNGHTDRLEKDSSWIPVDGFPNAFSSTKFQSAHDIGSAPLSGIKSHKNSQHDHCHSSKHQYKHSHHRHHHRLTGLKKKTEQKRFCRTASALKEAGLLELTLQTAQLIQENESLQKEINSLQQQTVEFSKSLQEQLEEKVKNSKTNNGLS